MRHKSGRQQFRITWVRPWLLAVAILAVPALIAAVGGLIAGQPEALLGIPAVLGVGGAVVLIPILITASTSRWDVDAEGIGGRDNWHIYRWVAWSEIDSVSPMLIPGYRFVWVNAAGRNHAFWLPLFLTDMHGFRKAVARYADEDNPLRRYLGKRVPA
jgi:hypothetical protein